MVQPCSVPTDGTQHKHSFQKTIDFNFYKNQMAYKFCIIKCFLILQGTCLLVKYNFLTNCCFEIYYVYNKM